ncbi:hypothetical protein [Conexibacter woesei]|uniref:Secreted protein n=1 Tax=Conexibacter woesei (strain DSM 14684 / CCUG 47730 / CIP 108061 / JCM 11494 / NBRC 100937 / ID131577) TaxID=469383 RepID=D3FFG2_CONWI|nr:hypothetical protein [Conexibacter woesei]ADB53755.1 hypothetical protein Cwoe_5350 [Conexibacter woesei DSM 14684]
MRLHKKLLGAGVGALVAGCLGMSATATAAFPNFSDCPRGSLYCVDVQSTGGSMDIKGFRVPLGDSLNIRGGLVSPDGSQVVFTPPAGTNGFFSKSIQVPGGLLGIDFPLPGNAVRATAKLAGPPSAIKIGLDDFSLRMPMKLELRNPLIGPWCQIGSDRNPVTVNLHIARFGTPDFPAGGGLLLYGNTHVDSTFSIPGASNCGLTLGLIDALVNAKLRLPSSSGNNTITIDNNFGFVPGS